MHFEMGFPIDLISNHHYIAILIQTLKAFLPDMIASNHGHVVTIASAAGFFGVPGLIDYTAR